MTFGGHCISLSRSAGEGRVRAIVHATLTSILSLQGRARKGLMLKLGIFDR